MTKTAERRVRSKKVANQAHSLIGTRSKIAAEPTLTTAREGRSAQRIECRQPSDQSCVYDVDGPISKTFRDTSKDLHFTYPHHRFKNTSSLYTPRRRVPVHQPSRRHRTRWPAWLAPIRQSHRHRNPKALGSIPSETRKTERNC